MPEVILGGIPKAHLESHQLSPMHHLSQATSLCFRSTCAVDQYDSDGDEGIWGAKPQHTKYCSATKQAQTIERSPTEVPCLWGLDGSTIAWSLHGASIACHLVEASSLASVGKQETGKNNKNKISKKKMLTLSLWENTPTSSTALKISQILSLSFQRISPGQSLGRKCLRGWRKNLYVYVLYLQKWITGAANLEVWG